VHPVPLVHLLWPVVSLSIEENRQQTAALHFWGHGKAGQVKERWSEVNIAVAVGAGKNLGATRRANRVCAEERVKTHPSGSNAIKIRCFIDDRPVCGYCVCRMVVAHDEEQVRLVH
jgi:hypothetical protein